MLCNKIWNILFTVQPAAPWQRNLVLSLGKQWPHTHLVRIPLQLISCSLLTGLLTEYVPVREIPTDSQLNYFIVDTTSNSVSGFR